MSVTVRIANPEATHVVVVINGVEWHGVRCLVTNNVVEIIDDGEIARTASEWIADGNTVQPYVPSPPTLAQYEEALQNHIDSVARLKNYKDGALAVSWASSSVPAWAAEGNAFKDWRDAVFVYAYQQLALVQSGQRAIPTVQELIAELPTIDWPQT